MKEILKELKDYFEEKETILLKDLMKICIKYVKEEHKENGFLSFTLPDNLIENGLLKNRQNILMGVGYTYTYERGDKLIPLYRKSKLNELNKYSKIR
jgi:hypothetical protein